MKKKIRLILEYHISILREKRSTYTIKYIQIQDLLAIFAKTLISSILAVSTMTESPSLSKVRPRFEELPFFCPKLKGMVAIGTFVSCNGKIYRTIRRGISSNDENENTLVVNEFIGIGDSNIQPRAVLEAGLSLFNELVQGCKCTTISASEIEEIAFVFHEKDVKEYHVAHGFQLAYFVRFTLTTSV